jgi:hypothetical protein
MARIQTTWNKISPGDIISFKYKGLKKESRMQMHTVIVLNYKLPTNTKAGRVYEVVGLKLKRMNKPTIKPSNRTRMLLEQMGTIEWMEQSQKIYRVNITPTFLSRRGAKPTLYKRIKKFIEKNDLAVYRTYNWELAKKSPVYYETIRLPKDSVVENE